MRDRSNADLHSFDRRLREHGTETLNRSYLVPAEPRASLVGSLIAIAGLLILAMIAGYGPIAFALFVVFVVARFIWQINSARRQGSNGHRPQ